MPSTLCNKTCNDRVCITNYQGAGIHSSFKFNLSSSSVIELKCLFISMSLNTSLLVIINIISFSLVNVTEFTKADFVPQWVPV